MLSESGPFIVEPQSSNHSAQKLTTSLSQVNLERAEWTQRGLGRSVITNEIQVNGWSDYGTGSFSLESCADGGIDSPMILIFRSLFREENGFKSYLDAALKNRPLRCPALQLFFAGTLS